MKTSTIAHTLLAAAFCFTSAHAAILTNVTSSATATSDVDLSSLGTTNWAAWDSASGSTSSIGATHFKASGTGTISAITGSDGTNVRGTGNTGSYPSDVFSWTQSDESSNLAAPADGIISGVFNSSLDDDTVGITFSITNLASLGGSGYYEINLFATAFRAQGALSADINGDGGSLISQNGTTQDAVKNTDRYTIAYNPDSSSDVLNIYYDVLVDLSGSGDTSSHAAFQAVTISAVPEPSAFALISGGLAMAWITLARRRR